MANMNIYDYTEGDVTFHSMHDLRAKLEKQDEELLPIDLPNGCSGNVIGGGQTDHRGRRHFADDVLSPDVQLLQPVVHVFFLIFIRFVLQNGQLVAELTGWSTFGHLFLELVYSSFLPAVEHTVGHVLHTEHPDARIVVFCRNIQSVPCQLVLHTARQTEKLRCLLLPKYRRQ